MLLARFAGAPVVLERLELGFQDRTTLFLGHRPDLQSSRERDIGHIIERRPLHEEEVPDGREAGTREQCTVTDLLLLGFALDDDRETGILDGRTLADPRKAPVEQRRSQAAPSNVGPDAAPHLVDGVAIADHTLDP